MFFVMIEQGDYGNGYFKSKKSCPHIIILSFPPLFLLCPSGAFGQMRPHLKKKTFCTAFAQFVLAKLKPKCCLPCLNNKGLWKWIFLKQKKLSRNFQTQLFTSPSAMLILELFTKNIFIVLKQTF
jgi:hypothetical protein